MISPPNIIAVIVSHISTPIIAPCRSTTLQSIWSSLAGKVVATGEIVFILKFNKYTIR